MWLCPVHACWGPDADRAYWWHQLVTIFRAVKRRRSVTKALVGLFRGSPERTMWRCFYTLEWDQTTERLLHRQRRTGLSQWVCVNCTAWLAHITFDDIGSCDEVSDHQTSTKLGTPEPFSHWRESFYFEHRPLNSTLSDAGRVLILLTYDPGFWGVC